MKYNKESNQNIDDANKKYPPWERPLFLIIITFVGGYMNAYTYITRNKILANMHTANMSKFGINIALGQYNEALRFFLPILACILGAAFSQFIKSLLLKNNYKDDWRKAALILESLAFFCIGLIPTYVSDFLVANLVSFLMGYQLCLFRECLGVAFNTTISTGNLRNVGQLLYNTIDKKTISSLKKFLIFTILTFSFAAGTIPGTLISMAINTKAVWVCTIILLIEVVWMHIYENNY